MLTWIGIETQDMEVPQSRQRRYNPSIHMGKDGIRVIDAGSWLMGMEERKSIWNMYPPKEGILLVCTEEGYKKAAGYEVALLWQWQGEGSEVPENVTYMVQNPKELERDYLEEVYCRYHGYPLIIAETDRLQLREMTIKDISDVWSCYQACPEAFAQEPPSGLEDARQFWAAYIRHMYEFYGYGMWLAYAAEDGKLLGRAGLEHIAQEDLIGSVRLKGLLKDEGLCLQAGYMVLPEHRGKGYGKELLRLCTGHGFERACARHIILLIEPDNSASIALARQAGFEPLEQCMYQQKKVIAYVKECNINKGIGMLNH